jgi:hypothetical protein
MTADPTGSVKTNVLPFPSSLSTQMRPPCSSTNRFDEREAQPGPLALLDPRLGLLELVEDPFVILGRDPWARVADRDPHLAINP